MIFLGYHMYEIDRINNSSIYNVDANDIKIETFKNKK